MTNSSSFAANATIIKWTNEKKVKMKKNPHFIKNLKIGALQLSAAIFIFHFLRLRRLAASQTIFKIVTHVFYNNV